MPIVMNTRIGGVRCVMLVGTVIRAVQRGSTRLDEDQVIIYSTLYLSSINVCLGISMESVQDSSHKHVIISQQGGD
jgi:hypothetical protein